MTEIERLLDKIKEHNNAYRSGISLVSDKEYDAEIEKLRQLDPNNDWFKHIEPAPVGEARKVKLPIPMKSLYKVKDMAALQNWVDSLGIGKEDMIVVTPKFDGLSLLHNETTGMTYSRGGADNEGQDCSAHYRAATAITNVPTKLQFTYGEFVFNRMSWENNMKGKLSPDTGEPYKSPRNTAAGLLNRDQPSANLSFIDFFRYGTDDESLQQFDTYVELYTYLCRKFDQQFLYDVVRTKDITDEYLHSLYKHWNKEYYIDGLVLYANDLTVWDRVGRQATTGNPLYAVAYKHPDFTETFDTKVKSVTWKQSKSGAFKPVVNIEAVDTGDCTMENPTGYNAKYLYENRIGKGAEIVVTRSGGVIPKILETLTPCNDAEFDKMWEELCVCPDCGAPTTWNDTKVELMCSNPNCKGKRLAKIIFFFTTLGAENMGEETITKLFNAGYNTVGKILDITFDELLDIEGFGEGIANQIMNAISLIQEGIEVTYLMHASDCFAGIGQVKAKKILEAMSKEQRFGFYDGKAAPWTNEDELYVSPFFQSANVTMRNFLLGIQPFYQFVAENHLKMLPLKEAVAPTGNKYAGFKVCFTGVRDAELEKEIVDGGGEIASGVSKKTTHLVVADLTTTSSKAIKAQTMGIPILTIDGFKAL